jgi:tripartite-type tricarboxylate transporter receptor subunit TctC
MRRRQLIQLSAAAVAAPSLTAFAQAAFPSKPIKLIIAFPARRPGTQ